MLLAHHGHNIMGAWKFILPLNVSCVFGAIKLSDLFPAVVVSLWRIWSVDSKINSRLQKQLDLFPHTKLWIKLTLYPSSFLVLWPFYAIFAHKAGVHIVFIFRSYGDNHVSGGQLIQNDIRFSAAPWNNAWILNYHLFSTEGYFS